MEDESKVVEFDHFEIEIIEFTKLDFGCGAFRKKNYFGIDNFEAAEYQGMTDEQRKFILQWDLNRGIPYPDNSITDIYISHFIEHVISPSRLLWECYRVCKHGSHIEIYVPLHEMKSIGHITEFHKNWFEEFFLTEMPGKCSIVHKSILKDKTVPIRISDTKTEMRSFDELNIVFKVVK